MKRYLLIVLLLTVMIAAGWRQANEGVANPGTSKRFQGGASNPAASSPGDVFFNTATGAYLISPISSGVWTTLQATTGSNLTVTTKTAGYPVVAGDTGTIFNNTGAGGAVNFTLPTPVAGMSFTWIVTTAQTLQVTATNSATIRLAGSVSAANGNITNAVIGGTVTLVAMTSTSWIATAINGAWTVT